MNNRNFRAGGLPALIRGGYWVAALLYWEGLLRLSALGGFTGRVGYLAGFTLCAGLLVAAILSFLPRKGGFWGDLVLSLGLMMLYGSQMVYFFIFGSLYSVALMDQGGAALTSFWRETLAAMGSHFPWLLALAVPVAVLAVLGRVLRGRYPKPGLGWQGILAGLSLLSFLITGAAIKGAGTGMFSDYDYYHSGTIATDQVAQRFGLLTTLRLELFGSGEEEKESVYYVPAATQPEIQETGPAAEAEEAPVYGTNVLELDLEALNGKTGDEKLLAINEYCARLPGTSQSEYTGLLKDYNLIVLCGESFSTAAIHPEVTPTLYKLSREGFVFTNYFNAFPNTTTDGEYALTQGLWPDSSRKKESSSLYASRNSYLPFTLGNAFLEQRGVQCYGYHNYRGSYYGRDESHPNMGYQMKFAGSGMTFSSSWPASDLEMIEQSVDDYIHQEPFHAYYMTFSGHYRYAKKNNAIAAKNWNQVKDLPYASEAEKAYLSCNVELDKALEYLLARLEEAGVADRTAIVLTGDHFPYGLTETQYADLLGGEIDAFTKYRSSLIFWVGGMETPVTVEEYCCNVDILPTLLNLWGLEFDSRLLAGTDVFSDGTHVAILKDKSWLTDKVWFQADTGEIRYLVPEETLPENYVENMNLMVATRFSISSDMLNSAYYNFVFGKEDVQVDRKIWGKVS